MHDPEVNASLACAWQFPAAQKKNNKKNKQSPAII
jgi:hypothetical protein